MTTIPIPNPFKITRPRVTRPISVYDIRPAEESLVELENIADHDDLGFEEHEDFDVLVHKVAEGEFLVVHSATVLKVGPIHYLDSLSPQFPRSSVFSTPSSTSSHPWKYRTYNPLNSYPQMS
jgi:hypothetical protein